MTEKNNLNLIKDAASLINSIRSMYNNYVISFRNKIFYGEEYEVEESMLEKSEQEDQFILKLNSIESFLEDKNISLAKREIFAAKKLIQKKEYCQQIGIGNIYALQDYFNEAFSQLNNSQ